MASGINCVNEVGCDSEHELEMIREKQSNWPHPFLLEGEAEGVEEVLDLETGELTNELLIPTERRKERRRKTRSGRREEEKRKEERK